MQNALEAVTGKYQDNIRFGLLEFPTDNDCAVDQGTAVRVPVDLHQASAISSYFQSQSADGNTPAAQGLAAALTYYQGIPVNTAGQYVLFATDGDPNCSTATRRPRPSTRSRPWPRQHPDLRARLRRRHPVTTPCSTTRPGRQGAQGRRPAVLLRRQQLDRARVGAEPITGGIIVPSCSYTLASAPPDPTT